MPPAHSVAELLRRHAATDPEGMAVVVDGVATLTYGEWEQRSNALARGLMRRGGGQGERVVLLFDNARLIDFACAYVGAHKASMVPVLLPLPLFGREILRVVADCGASVVLCPPELAPAGRVGSLVATLSELEAEETEDPFPLPPRTGGVAEILYKSSPLARPRATAVSHHDLDPPPWSSVSLLHTFAPGTLAAQHALRLPLHHQGATIVALPRFDLERVLAVAAGGRLSAVGLSPAVARVIAGSGVAIDRDLSFVRHVLLSGPVPPTTSAGLAAVFPAASLIEAWGAEPPDRVPHHRSGAGAILPDTAGRRPAVGRAALSRPPLAFSQEGLLWYELLAPTCMNLPPVVRRLVGPLDVSALEAALNEMVRRHEPLRTTFEVVDGQGTQVVGEPVPVDLRVTDLSASSPTDRHEEVARLVREAMSTPFDLVTGPMFRPRLLRLGAEEHLLVLGLNHTFWDDWSEGVFERNLSRLYESFLVSKEPQLPDLAVRFADFARTQREALAGAAGDAHLSYWRDALAGAPLVTQLPVADPARPQGSPQPPGPPLSIELGPHLSGQMGELARDLHVTTFMAMLAAFVVLVHRYTGQNDVLLASVVANRDRPELHGLIGAFAKKILLRVRVDDDPEFSELVARARRSVLGAMSHQDLPYETLLQEALGQTATAHGLVPHVGVMFQGLVPPRGKASLRGVETSRFDARQAGVTRAHFASGRGEHSEARPWGSGLYNGTFVRLLVMETPEGLTCQAWGAFHPPAVDRLLGDYRAMLIEIAANPHRRVSELDLPLGQQGTGTKPTELVDSQRLDLRGFHIDPGHLEAALTACPGIDAAGVALRRTGSGDEQLVAYVVPSGPAPPELTEVRHRIWAQLPGHAWPAAMVPVKAIPRLPDGRPDIARLPAPPIAQVGPAARSDFVVPRTPEEHLLAACWAEVLGVDEVSATESYWQRFSFLEAVALARQAGAEVTTSDIKNNRTVETLAAALSSRKIDEEPDDR